MASILIIGKRFAQDIKQRFEANGHHAFISSKFCRGAADHLILAQRPDKSDDIFYGEVGGSLFGIDTWINDIEVTGSIVVISSLASERITESQGLGYHVAKAGLNQLVRWYAVQGKRINAVMPSHLALPEIRESTLDLIEFLCSDKAKAIKGQIIAVDNAEGSVWRHE